MGVSFALSRGFLSLVWCSALACFKGLCATQRFPCFQKVVFLVLRVFSASRRFLFCRGASLCLFVLGSFHRKGALLGFGKGLCFLSKVLLWFAFYSGGYSGASWVSSQGSPSQTRGFLAQNKDLVFGQGFLTQLFRVSVVHHSVSSPIQGVVAQLLRVFCC